MNLYLISQRANQGPDTYDSAIVCAETEDEARHTYPDTWGGWEEDRQPGAIKLWCDPEDVVVELIGVALDNIPKGPLLSSFNGL